MDEKGQAIWREKEIEREGKIRAGGKDWVGETRGKERK